jgi:hypothetical protein
VGFTSLASLFVDGIDAIIKKLDVCWYSFLKVMSYSDTYLCLPSKPSGGAFSSDCEDKELSCCECEVKEPKEVPMDCEGM